MAQFTENGDPQRAAAMTNNGTKPLTTQLEVRLFGAFRKYERGQPVVALEVPVGASAAQVKRALCEYLSREFEDFEESELVADSALASDKRVLLDDEGVDGLGRLAILPPVCGG